MIRIATADDVPALLDIAKTFIAETSYGVEFDEAVSTHHLQTYIAYPDADILLSVTEGIDGAAMVAASREFQKQPFCYVGKFYVRPDRRSLGVGRELMKAIDAWAALKGCSHTFVTATAGLDARQQKLFINLMKKFGFLESGPVLFKKG